jgi:hypothetical protein
MEGLSEISSEIVTPSYGSEPLIEAGTAINIGPGVPVGGHASLFSFCSVIVGSVLGMLVTISIMPVSLSAKIGLIAMGCAVGVMVGAVVGEKMWDISERKAINKAMERVRKTFIKYLGKHPEQAEYFTWNERSFLSKSVSGCGVAISDGTLSIIDRDMMCRVTPSDFVSYVKKEPIFTDEAHIPKPGDAAVLKGGLFIELKNQNKKIWQFTTTDAASMKRCEVMLNLFAAGITTRPKKRA